ncbi:MAG: hypothetical protein M1114_01155 [Candidatus Dependentiae bacterium]|nr:hypothetical protein [Candidatus Dependentiae bacterium]
MKTNIIRGILLLILAIPVYAMGDCDSCHKHHGRSHHRQEREYDYGDGKLRQNRSGYTFTDQIHTADYHDNIDRVNRGNAEPFGPQEFEDYGDSEYEEYNNPYEDYIHYSASLDVNKQTTYVDYLPTYYRTYPYYIGHKSGPFFGNSYGF